MADDFEYVSRARLEYRDGYRNAWLGDMRRTPERRRGARWGSTRWDVPRTRA